MQEQNPTTATPTLLEHARSGVAQLHACVKALRAELRQNQTAARTPSLGVLDRKAHARQLQRQLALLAPLYRAARAYESNLHATNRKVTPAYATYFKYYGKLLAELQGALARAGARQPTAFVQMDRYQWLPLLRPQGDGQTLLLGPCAAQLLDELALEQQRARALVDVSRKAFLSSLSAEQVALLQAVFKAQETAQWHSRAVAFQNSDILALQA